jgi:uncharacterized RDD family membrane protein YckC
MRFAVSQLIFGRISIFSCANDVIEGGKKPFAFYFIFFLNKLNVIWIFFFFKINIILCFFFFSKKKIHHLSV